MNGKKIHNNNNEWSDFDNIFGPKKSKLILILIL